MRTLALAASLMLSGCFFMPFEGPGLVGSTQAFLYCTPTEDVAVNTSVEGTWQDYGFHDPTVNFKVFKFEQGKVQEIDFDGTGKITRPMAGTYTFAQSRIAIAWDDGKTETVDVTVEDTPGCEMMGINGSEGEAPRITQENYFERVNCDFSSGETPATESTTPVMMTTAPTQTTVN